MAAGSIERQLAKLLQSRAQLFALLFFLFALLNISTLANPPYWDEILGLHNQAIYLARSNFDLPQLYRAQEQFRNGGSCVYPFGIMPFVYGALYSLLPPVAVHIAGHLINLASLAAAGMLFLRLVRKFCSPGLTLLWGIAAFSEPILSGRMAAQGQEAALALGIMLSLSLFFNRREKAALATAFAACLIKTTGIVLLCAYAVWFLYAAAAGPVQERRKKLLAALASGAAAVLFYSSAALLATQDYPEKSGVFHLGIALLRYHLVHFYPWVALKLAAALLLFAYLFFRRRLPSACRMAILPVFLGGFFAAYFIYTGPQLVRYSAIAMLPLTLLLAYGFRACGEKRATLAAAVLCALQLMNQYGALLPELPPHLAADPSQLERSREFLKVIEMNRAFAREVENAPALPPLVCKWPYPQILTMPELRYVSRPLENVFSYGLHARYAPAPEADPATLSDGNTLYLYAADSMDSWFLPRFAPPPGVRVVYAADLGGRPALLLFSGIRLLKTP
ncbi:hypothetical protein FYJ85_06955 [Victivallaceae bacterium BBE-744-WT-12]|uniref:Dolichyl-phosphate-mannose-protein mannosyltransferase n=1 Tax=Victivallis lenta TaxID=2606640 RepID=A0A844G0W1_9BACT|nr:hypothetical protein [Victivallis lenta]MST96783.1 hypothetical protein [Victivallis lenta]